MDWGDCFEMPSRLSRVCCWLLPLAAASAGGSELSDASAARARGGALFYFGSAAERAHDREGALAAYGTLLGSVPGDAALAFRAARLAAMGENLPQGRRWIDGVIAAAPDRPEGYIGLARYLDLYQPRGGREAFSARALDAAQLASERFPADLAVCVLNVDLLLARGRAGDALEAVRRCAAARADGVTDPGGRWLGLAREAERIAGHGAAEAAEEVAALYARAVEVDPTDPAVVDPAANHHIGERRYGRAIEVLEPLVAAHPELALPREKLARLYRIAGRGGDALAAARSMVRAFPNEARTQRLLAELCEEAGDFEGAVAARSRAAQLAGVSEEDALAIAVALADEIDPPRRGEALRWIDRGLAAAPASHRLHHMRAIVLVQVGRDGEAASSYRQAERIAAAVAPEVLDPAFYYRWGAAAARAGEVEEARRLLSRSVEAVPEGRPELAAPALNYHGYLLVERGIELEAAGEMLLRAVRLDPDNPDYLDSLGWLYYHEGQLRKAQVELRRAVQLLGGEAVADPRVVEHLRAVREALGDPPS